MAGHSCVLSKERVPLRLGSLFSQGRVLKMLRTVIGDGRSANAWSDSWVPDLPNSRISSSRSPILQGGVGNMPEKRDCHLSSELGDTPTKELERASLQASWDAKLVIFIFFPFFN
ncbi:hypothetical protein NC653_027467 [Populus alba x Populus x berolinensis]|uniref:Uncharacterized protein n=1 Tax=Populus alba x Populus x berolinensis TaxID=444605 RepID=A0AAD6M5S7_9ROSI|nr:hypothetical protein NC653_027467 [Populus alba x Populus x berolinensis]